MVVLKMFLLKSCISMICQYILNMYSSSFCPTPGTHTALINGMREMMETDAPTTCRLLIAKYPWEREKRYGVDNTEWTSLVF